VTGDDNDNTILVGGGFDKASDSDDEEVELCRCIHCLELDDELEEAASAY
jgi:hypothetical protein